MAGNIIELRRYAEPAPRRAHYRPETWPSSPRPATERGTSPSRGRQRESEQDIPHCLLRAAAVGQRVLLRHHAAGVLLDAARAWHLDRAGAGGGADLPDGAGDRADGVRAGVGPVRAQARDRRRARPLPGGHGDRAPRAEHRRGARGPGRAGVRQRLRHRGRAGGAARHQSWAGAGAGHGAGDGDLRAGADLGAARGVWAGGVGRLARDLPGRWRCLQAACWRSRCCDSRRPTRSPTRTRCGPPGCCTRSAASRATGSRATSCWWRRRRSSASSRSSPTRPASSSRRSASRGCSSRCCSRRRGSASYWGRSPTTG